MKLAVGFVLSNLYVHVRVDVFVAKSVAHKYNVLSHSVLSVIIVQLVYVVPALVQFAALIQLYLAVHKFVSVCVNTIEISAFFHVVEPLLAFITGTIVSYVVFIVFDSMFPLVAESFATHAHTFTLTGHCVFGVIINVYLDQLTTVNVHAVPHHTVISPTTKLYTVLLKSAVTVNDQFVYAGTVDDNITVGAHVSFIIVYVFELIGHPQVSDIFIITLVVHSAGMNHVERFAPILVHVDPLSFDIATVIGDGPHEFTILHVTLPA